jgi:hypothetical protein
MYNMALQQLHNDASCDRIILITHSLGAHPTLWHRPSMTSRRSLEKSEPACPQRSSAAVAAAEKHVAFVLSSGGSPRITAPVSVDVAELGQSATGSLRQWEVWASSDRAVCTPMLRAVMASPSVQWQGVGCNVSLDSQQRTHAHCGGRTRWNGVPTGRSGTHDTFRHHRERCDHCSPDRADAILAARAKGRSL